MMELAGSNTGSDTKVVSGAAAVAPGPVGGMQGEPSSAGAGSQPAGAIRPVAEIMSELLADRNVPCPVCEYNLRGCQQSTCPECGSPLGLSVVSPRVIPHARLPLLALLFCGIAEVLALVIALPTARLSPFRTEAMIFVAPSIGVMFGVLIVLPEAWRAARGRGDVQRGTRRAITRALVVAVLVATARIAQLTFVILEL